MDAISSLTDSAITVADQARSDQTLDSQEFMQIMITELTNQDPFEPMKNQELLNQMATIQQMESNQTMADSFEKLMENFDNLLDRDAMSTATRLIGEMVSGPSTSGPWAMGKVSAVTTADGEIQLELDTGQKINWDAVERIGGNSGKDIIGNIAIGQTDGGVRVAGKVAEVELSGDDIILHLNQYGSETDETVAVSMSNASLITEDTADLLIGHQARGQDIAGSGELEGIIESVRWTDSDQVVLKLRHNTDDAIVGEILLDSISRLI